ncbi:MAG: hypothetical protein COB53_07550 [Elusimicrobia bacterium]|nr:MAG: hypothetical protein COB53_07550 [Elusimicrobiota bacterium]
MGLIFSLLAANFLAASVHDCVGAMHVGASPAFRESLQAARLAPRLFVVPVGTVLSSGHTADGRDWKTVRGRHFYDVKKGINDAFVGAERPCRTVVHERGHQVFVLLAFTPGWEKIYSRISNRDAGIVFPEDAYCRNPDMPQEYFACASQVWCGVYPEKSGPLSSGLVSVMKTVYGEVCRMPSRSDSK